MEIYNNITLKIIFDLMILLIFYVFIKLIFLPFKVNNKEYKIQILIKKYIKLIFIFSFYFLIYLQF
jgi:hypothetical protein